MSSGMTIGYPLGGYGLGGYGAFSSFDGYMPSMMGMGMGYGGYGMYGMNQMMMYPAFMAQMQNQMEVNKLNHAAYMQEATLNHEVHAQKVTNSALFNKTMQDASIQQGIQNLYAKVKERDQDGICEEFDKLKQYVYATYKDDLVREGYPNANVGATEYIERMYASLVSKQEQRPIDLRTHILENGDGAFRNGFMSTFKSGHNGRYTEETLNHLFGESINHKGHHDTNQRIGSWAGSAAHTIKTGAVAATGATALGVTGAAIWSASKAAFGKTGTEIFNLRKFASRMGKFGVFAFLAGMGLDAYNQITGKNILGITK